MVVAGQIKLVLAVRVLYFSLGRLSSKHVRVLVQGRLGFSRWVEPVFTVGLLVVLLLSLLLDFVRHLLSV